MNKPKGAAQIICERGFTDLEGKLPDGRKVSMNGTSSKDPVTSMVTIDKTTSALSILKRCSDFQNEQTQMMFICSLLLVKLLLTPKCHPEISGRGVEYAWGYSKLRFRIDFNDAIAAHLQTNVEQSLDRDIITINRIRKFARKTREYKLTYALINQMSEGKDKSSGKDEIEHLTKMSKAHRSAMDADYGFIAAA